MEGKGRTHRALSGESLGCSKCGHWKSLRTYWKCRIPDPALDLVNQKLLSNNFSGDLRADENVRSTILYEPQILEGVGHRFPDSGQMFLLNLDLQT